MSVSSGIVAQVLEQFSVDILHFADDLEVFCWIKLTICEHSCQILKNCQQLSLK